MKIKSVEFIQGVAGDEKILHEQIRQVAFVGRSNVGKSSVINTLVGKQIARSSNTPGKTREINLYLVNKDFYLVDLPGYGFAKGDAHARDYIKHMILWYLFFSDIPHKKIVLILDAVVGPTKDDLNMIRRLNEREKDLIIVVNKIDKLKKSESQAQLNKIQKQVGKAQVLPYSAEKKIGIAELSKLIEVAND